LQFEEKKEEVPRTISKWGDIDADMGSGMGGGDEGELNYSRVFLLP